MNADFKEPTLELHRLIDAFRINPDCEIREKLRQYLLSKYNINVYKKCVDYNLLEHNQKDFDYINLVISDKIKEYENKRKENTENEAALIELDKKMCEFYAQIMDVHKFEELSNDILERDFSSSLKMDILMCKIRISIIQEDRAELISNIEKAKILFESTSDWDRKNRFNVYLGLFYLIKAEFDKSVEYFLNSLASFDAEELLSFEAVILYLVFSSLLVYSRSEIKEKIIKNSEVRKCSDLLLLVECLIECKYDLYFKRILEFVNLMENDYFLFQFKEHFCKEMKIRGYQQLLISYKSFHLHKMSEIFNVNVKHIEQDLRNFINEGRIDCIIDRIDGVVRMEEIHRNESINKTLNGGVAILRDIKRSIN